MELEFKTQEQVPSGCIYGGDDAEYSGVANIEWRLQLIRCSYGVRDVIKIIDRISIEVEKIGGGAEGTEYFIVGNPEGCKQAFDSRYHGLYEDDFEIKVYFELQITGVEVDFDRREILIQGD